MKDLIKVIEQESYEYSDPITGEAYAHTPFRGKLAPSSSPCPPGRVNSILTAPF